MVQLLIEQSAGPTVSIQMGTLHSASLVAAITYQQLHLPSPQRRILAPEYSHPQQAMDQLSPKAPSDKPSIWSRTRLSCTGEVAASVYDDHQGSRPSDHNVSALTSPQYDEPESFNCSFGSCDTTLACQSSNNAAAKRPRYTRAAQDSTHSIQDEDGGYEYFGAWRHAEPSLASIITQLETPPLKLERPSGAQSPPPSPFPPSRSKTTETGI